MVNVQDSYSSQAHALCQHRTPQHQSQRVYLGKPACWARSASMTAAPGSFSEGFSTKVLPAVTATGNIHRGIMAGKLKGQMPAHTCA